jgi:hypothetical protein
MAIKSIFGFIGKRELIALAILTSAFAIFLAFHLGVWTFVVVSVLFIGYASRTASTFFVTQQSFSGRRIAAFAWPVGFAVIQTLACLGLVGLVVWAARRLFGH